MSGREVEKNPGEDNSTAAYTSVAVGIGLVIAAILITIAVGAPVAGIGFIIGATACLGYGIPQLVKRKNVLPAADNRERELLSAIRSNGGDITPAEAAMETSLTVKEADGMLTDLANEGHLRVESRDGVLSYALPSRPKRELG